MSECGSSDDESHDWAGENCRLGVSNGREEGICSPFVDTRGFTGVIFKNALVEGKLGTGQGTQDRVRPKIWFCVYVSVCLYVSSSMSPTSWLHNWKIFNGFDYDNSECLSTRRYQQRALINFWLIDGKFEQGMRRCKYTRNDIYIGSCDMRQSGVCVWERERERERVCILPLDLFHVEMRYVVSSILTHPPFPLP
jgi:hypothetical protein